MIRRRFLPDQAVGGSQSGFTLLEVLLATVLLAVPVVAVQMLMLQSVSHGRGTAQQQLALQAGETALSRIFAFHSLGLWPDHLTPPGSWLPALAATITPKVSAEPPRAVSIAGVPLTSGWLMSTRLWRVP